MGKAKRLWLFLSLSMVIAWMLMMRPVLAEEAAPQAAEPQGAAPQAAARTARSSWSRVSTTDGGS